VTAGNKGSHDLEKGKVYNVGDVGVGNLPQDVVDYLVADGLLVETEGTEDNAWFDSDDPDLAGDDYAATVENRVKQEVQAAFPEGTEVDVKVKITPPKEDKPAPKGDAVTSTKTSSTAKS
jgi:hypothetical protein